MTLRRLFLIGGLLLAGLAFASAAALLAATRIAEHTTVELSEAVAGVRAAEELELALLVHNHEKTLFALTGSPVHAVAAQQAVANFQRWRAEAELLVDDTGEQDMLTEVERSASEYFEAWRESERLHRNVADTYRAVTPELEEAYAASEKLLNRAVEQAAAARAATERYGRVVVMAGVGIIAVFLAILAALLAIGRNWLYGPLRTLREVIRRYARGETSARMPPLRIRELSEVGQTFNDMATALERHRAARLGFLAAIAHDLRNPLTALRAAMLAVGPGAEANPGQAARAFAVVDRQIERLDRMVGDLLDTAHIEAGQLELRRGRVDVGDLVKSAVELFAAGATQHALDVECEADAWVFGDAARIEQVVNNLISNALKYSPGGGPVHVAVQRDDDEVRILVRDCGVGIPAAEIEHIFEPFRRGTASLDGIPGVGLGLAVAQHIVRAHGGTVAVESRVGVGTEFIVHLPRERGDAIGREEPWADQSGRDMT